MSANDLHVLFLVYGDDPIVVPDESEQIEHPRFSARDYVQEIIDEFCLKLEKQ